jgi:molybdopterin molybdotransferase
MVTFMMLVRPFILRLQGIEDVTPRSYTLPADFEWKKPDGRTEFLRARINSSGAVVLFPNQGAGVLSSLSWGCGLVANPPGCAVAPGDRVNFIPFSELN